MQYSDGCACCSLSAFEVEKTCFLVKYWRNNLRHIQLGPESQDVDNISVSGFVKKSPWCSLVKV